MEKKEAVEIVKKVAAWFPSWRVDKDTASIWVETLEGEKIETVTDNLQEYLKGGHEFAPSISQLVKEKVGERYLMDSKPFYASEEEREAARAQARRDAFG